MLIVRVFCKEVNRSQTWRAMLSIACFCFWDSSQNLQRIHYLQSAGQFVQSVTAKSAAPRQYVIGRIKQTDIELVKLHVTVLFSAINTAESHLTGSSIHSSSQPDDVCDVFSS